MRREGDYIGGRPLGMLGASATPITAYEENRRCVDCGMKLSKYNPETRCTICLPVKAAK